MWMLGAELFPLAFFSGMLGKHSSTELCFQIAQKILSKDEK